MQKHNIKSSLEYSSTPTGDRAGLFHGVTTATREECEDKPRRKIENVLHRLKQIPLGLYSYIASNGGMNLLRCSRTSSSNFETKVNSVSKLNDYIGRNKFIRVSAALATFMLVILASVTLVPLYNNISITEAATGTAATSSLTMNVTNAIASVDLSVLKDNGSFASSTNPIALNITTTNYSGYTLSIKNTKSATTLVNSTNNNYTLNSISSSISQTAFSEDSTSAGNSYNGKWGILPSKYNSANNANYRPAPTTTATTLDKTTAANSGANSYTIGLGIRAGYTQAAGTYTGTYTLTAVGNPINYVLTYDKNTTDTVADVPSNKSDSTSQTTITLDSTAPTREGYTFLGWCLGTITTTNNVDSCTGTTYQPRATFGIDQTTENKPTLKAMWEKNGPQEIGYLQDITLNDCKVNVGANGNATNIGDTLLAYDKRDEKDYTVRYINGYCWMTQNLRFTGTRLDSTTSNIEKTSKTLTYYDLSDEANKASDGPCHGNSSSGNGYANLCIKDSGSTADGVYYNYAAATVGTITGTTNSAAAVYDICPKGWRLPTGPNTTSNTDFYVLMGNTTSGWQDATTGLAVFNGIVSGYYLDGKFGGEGSYGRWWSATANSGKSSYYLDYNGNSGQFRTTSGQNNRYYGFSVRCVKTPSISDVTYMQDVTAEMVANMTTNQTATLTDSRDGQIYTTAKIGNLLWMTKNLAIGCSGSGSTYGSSISSKRLTSADSNASSTWSTPTALLSAASSSTETADFTTPRMQCNAAYGGYYNYAAATAGTITGSSNTTEASYSVCPSGWRLPTYVETQTIGTSSGSTTNVSAFSPVYSGYYLFGSLEQAGMGIWWSSTARDTTDRRLLHYSSGKLHSGGNYSRGYGRSIRCVRATS